MVADGRRRKRVIGGLSCVVLAGGAPDEVAALDQQAPNKAFVPVAGRTLIERTLEGLRGSAAIEHIIVVAPESARNHPALVLANAWRPDGPRITDSLRSGLSGLPPNDLVLIAASDLPLLTFEATNEFIRLAHRAEADAVYSCVERRTHLTRFPEIPHTWAHLRDGTYCGGGLMALRPRTLPALERFLERLGAARKAPLTLASILGWPTLLRYVFRRLSIADAERRITELLNAPARAAICTQPEIAVNVDRASDVALTERLMGKA